jgi:outer membrane receptor protein involved in Fe transport
MRFTTPEHRRQTLTDANNWGPRFGFAYNFAPNMVLRGAYGIAFAPSALQAAGTTGRLGHGWLQQPVGCLFHVR